MTMAPAAIAIKEGVECGIEMDRKQSEDSPGWFCICRMRRCHGSASSGL
ncbi:MAG: hypothetical protein AB7L09_21685 [Nitrospira sp.]